MKMGINVGISDSNVGHLVTKSNLLIEASFKLGVVEQKIIITLASNIQPDDDDFKIYRFSVLEFHKLLGLKGHAKYAELRQITKELMQKVAEVRIGDKLYQFNWLSLVVYNDREGTIDMSFTPFLRPYLLKLKREFTSYKLENVVKLKSSYSIRIYELLKQYEKIKERTISIAHLRKLIGAEDIYPAYGNFKQRVLVPAQKELQKKTDIHFDIEEVKNGRKVEKIKFLISSSKKQKADQSDSFKEKLEDFIIPNSFHESVKRLGLKLGVQIPDKTIKIWEKFGQAPVIDLLEKIQNRSNIDNPIGYITKVLNASAGNEVAASLENENLIARLMREFRHSKETLPDWLVDEKSIEYIKKWLKVEQGQAAEKFAEIKHELYGLLQLDEPDSSGSKQRSEKEKGEEKKRLLEMLRNL